MNDDVKLSKYQAAHARLSEIEGIVGAEPLIRMTLWDMERNVDGESARTAAAVAAAREEQARVDMDACNEALAHDSSWTPSLTATPLADRIAELVAELRATSGDHYETIGENADLVVRAEKAEAERDEARKELAALKKAVTDKLHFDMKALLDGTPERQLEAERDAYAEEAGKAILALPTGHYRTVPLHRAIRGLRAQLETETNLYKASMSEASTAIERLTAERDALRAQVEAAQAECEARKCAPSCKDSACYDSECHAARRILAAMDGAKP